jgi:hypothetical protein
MCVYMLQERQHWKPLELQNDISNEGLLYNFMNSWLFEKMLMHTCKTYLIVDGL